MDNLDHDQRKMIIPNKKYLNGRDVFKKEHMQKYKNLTLPEVYVYQRYRLNKLWKMTGKLFQMTRGTIMR